MAEILEKISLVFWKVWWHQKDILKLTELYIKEKFEHGLEILFSGQKFIFQNSKLFVQSCINFSAGTENSNFSTSKLWSFQI